MTNPCLYIVATPIGNLSDISIRAKEVLSSVHVIAAEDSRNTKKLFSLIGITCNKKFIAYEDHFEHEKVQEIIDIIKNGNDVALVSDAGSPLISDPGYKLVRECHKQGIKVTTIPGCCAVISALQMSGIPTNRFMFAGFVPNKDKARFDFFNDLKNINSTIVVYETAIRLLKTLKTIKELMPNREISIVREITKMYEECINGTIEEICLQIENSPIKGEIVLVIAPCLEEEKFEDIDVEKILIEELKESTLKDAVKKVSDTYKLKKSDVYEKALKIKNNTI
ncbi:MAG: 16S rRNA (cytidine(1402)-2'-O)-methyltransferase [Alphaproteobacteria bacterium]|nr:16S rRNA (cytidine(1402)-2'-O)-methyltransferase [Alphaproteobacteria bacterium]